MRFVECPLVNPQGGDPIQVLHLVDEVGLVAVENPDGHSHGAELREEELPPVRTQVRVGLGGVLEDVCESLEVAHRGIVIRFDGLTYVWRSEVRVHIPVKTFSMVKASRMYMVGASGADIGSPGFAVPPNGEHQAQHVAKRSAVAYMHGLGGTW